MSAIKYRPEIDGLRAVAVIPVVLFHLGYGWMQGGFVGVDVFFVISGFLICSIILREHEQGKFRFSDFWLRRIRRIFPALMAMLLVTLLLANFVVLGRGANQAHARHTVAAVLSVANVFLWKDMRNYWGNEAENSPLLHTWSLSVEEQFYLFFPILLILLLRFLPRAPIAALVAVNVLSFGLYVYSGWQFPEAGFFLLPMRVWEIGLGALGALIIHQKRIDLTRIASERWTALGLGLIFFSAIFFSGPSPFHGQLLLPVVGTLLVLLFSRSDTSPLTRGLSWGPVVGIGRASYSLYLWHWPIIVLGNYAQLRWGTEMNVAIYLVPMAVLSLLSYRMIEQQFRFRRGTPMLAACAAVCVIGLSSLLHIRQVQAEESPFRGGRAFMADSDPSGLTIINREIPGARHSIALFGNSHAEMIAPVVESLAKEERWNTCFAFQTGMALLDHPPGHPRHKALVLLLEQLREFAPEVIIVSGRWNNFEGDPARHLPLLEKLEELGSTILIVEKQPESFIGNTSMSDVLARLLESPPPPGEPVYLPAKDMGLYDETNRWLQSYSEMEPDVRLVPLSDLYLSKDEEVLVAIGAKLVYHDDDHLTRFGAELLRKRLREEVLQALVNDDEASDGHAGVEHLELK